MRIALSRALAVPALAGLLLAAAATTSFAAPVLTGTATVTESSTGLSDLVTIGAGPELVDGDVSNIANGFFIAGAGESIDLDDAGLTIVLRLFGGGVDLGGGYAGVLGSQTTDTFTFSGLTFAPSTVINGVSVSGVNVSGLAGTAAFTTNSVTFTYGSIGILASPGNIGTITLTLSVRDPQDPPPPPVPEPASLALLALGLAGVTAKRRRVA